MNIKILFLSVIAAFSLSSCYAVYSNFDVTTAKCIKQGVAQKSVWFGLGFKVDISIEKAAANGGITSIATVDYIEKHGLFRTRYYTHVCGE